MQEGQGRDQSLDRSQEVDHDRGQARVQEVQEVEVLLVNQVEAAVLDPEVRVALVRISNEIMFFFQISTRCISVHFGIIKRLRRIIQRKRNIVIIYIHNLEYIYLC